MIIDALIGFICAIPNMLLNSLSSGFSLVIPDGAFDWWYNVFSTLTYVFPVWSLVPIIISSVCIKAFQILLAFGIRVKSLIPFSGGA